MEGSKGECGNSDTLALKELIVAIADSRGIQIDVDKKGRLHPREEDYDRLADALDDYLREHKAN